MKSFTWHCEHDIRCDGVPDPKIEEGRGAIFRVTACAICGSGLHLSILASKCAYEVLARS